MNTSGSPSALIRRNANEIMDSPDDFNSLLESIGDSHFVLLGESTHGTHEFYKAKAQITIRLIEEKGFNAVAVEADWPDAYRVNRYVRSISDDSDPMSALNDFARFPAWVWRNSDVSDFISILKYYNENRKPEDMVGFYGLDLFNQKSSINAVINYLDRVDHGSAEIARKRYGCFGTHGPGIEDLQLHLKNVPADCINQAILQLEQIRCKGIEYVKKGGFALEEELFYAEQNARLTLDAEVYYRALLTDQVLSWNLREKYLTDTLEALANHLSRYKDPKIVVWVHNFHAGDISATEYKNSGRQNMGLLIRQRFGDDAFLAGFFTHTGTVSAASFWGGPVEKKKIAPSIGESFENLFHRSEIPSFYLLLRNNSQLSFLEHNRLQRAIGIIYKPEEERKKNYFQSSLFNQFDAVMHFDNTVAIQPFERNARWDEGQSLADTFDSGF